MICQANHTQVQVSKPTSHMQIKNILKTGGFDTLFAMNAQSFSTTVEPMK
jgi:hypothetical protein